MALDLLHSQGGMALYKNDFVLARVCYVRVLELDPQGAVGSENIAAAHKALRTPQLSAGAVSEFDVDIVALERRLNAALA